MVAYVFRLLLAVLIADTLGVYVAGPLALVPVALLMLGVLAGRIFAPVTQNAAHQGGYK